MKYFKSPTKIKSQMEFWFYNYYKSRGRDKKSAFTLFDLLDTELQQSITAKVDLRKEELIVFVLQNKKEEYIINTTHRFIKTDRKTTEEINYTDFKAIGLNQTASLQIKKIRRVEDEYTNCYLITSDDKFTIWSIKTMKINSFIQATKRCEFIGRKYI